MLWFILYFRLKGKGSASRTECQIYRAISVCPVIVIESAKMEKLMQYIWNHRLFGSAGLTTSDGKRLQVLDPGRLNTDAGPDFFNAKISIDGWLERYTGDWEEVCFVSLARTLGFGVNGDAFERTARSLPLLFLRKHADSLFQIEAFIFGQAGLLRHGDYPDDDYYTRLTREYAFLQNKFGLKPVEAGVWRFARMRPANFPHRRLALLAQFVYEGFNLFSKIVESGDDEAIRALFSVELSGYWQTHYTFGNSVPSAPTVLGEGAIDGIMINTVAPLFYAYGMRKGGEPYIDRALSLLENLKPERNSIVRQFVDARIAVKNALDSQAVIQLHNEYCLNKKCLYCRIGHRLLSQAAVRQ